MSARLHPALSRAAAVVFDLDDTLVDQRSAARTAVIAWAAEHGDRGANVSARWAAVSERHYRRWQAREVTFAEQRRGRGGGFLGVDVDDAEADRIFDGYLIRYEAGWRAVPHAAGTRAARKCIRGRTGGPPGPAPRGPTGRGGGPGVPGRHYRRWQAREVTFAEQRRGRVRDFLGVDVDDAEADRIFDGYLIRYEAGWRAFPDAAETLRVLSEAGLHVALLTNGDADQQHRKLRRTGLEAGFDAVVCSSDLERGKPHPMAFRAVLDRLGVAASAAVMVGDSVANDIAGADAVGMTTILFDPDDAVAEHPGYRIRRLTDLVLADDDEDDGSEGV
ncbi:HAD family hydrolase [Microbacterium gorillae]|uniref:HAD family hydrolase n=1 Tax=Microbacterium gorillae TaxID=1231063 RepID=UPI0006935F12|nr:HAD family hydrolase [Microbacterium gorillae]